MGASLYIKEITTTNNFNWVCLFYSFWEINVIAFICFYLFLVCYFWFRRSYFDGSFLVFGTRALDSFFVCVFFSFLVCVFVSVYHRLQHNVSVRADLTTFNLAAFCFGQMLFSNNKRKHLRCCSRCCFVFLVCILATYCSGFLMQSTFLFDPLSLYLEIELFA